MERSNQSQQQQQNGLWDRFLDQTSKDGFTKKVRPQSPQKSKHDTKGTWNNFMNRTSDTGFRPDYNAYASKQRGTLPKDHFEGGQTIVKVNDEGGLWNRKPLQKVNNAFKISHAFDNVKYPPTQKEIQERLAQVHHSNNVPRGQIQTQYDKYYHQTSQNNPKNTEYNNNFAQQQQNNISEFQKQQKVQKGKALPTPHYMKQFKEYKKQNDCLLL